MICDSWVLTWCEHDVCMGWFMELKWWVWYGFDMRHEWRLVMNMAWCWYEIEFYIRGLGRMNAMNSTWITNEDGL